MKISVAIILHCTLLLCVERNHHFAVAHSSEDKAETVKRLRSRKQGEFQSTASTSIGCDAATVFGPDVAVYNNPGRASTYANWMSRTANNAPILFPHDEKQLREIVQKANHHGCKVAIRGAGHSSTGIVMQKTETNVVAVHLGDLVLSSSSKWNDTWADQFFPGSDIYAPAPHRARIGAGKSLLDLSAMTRPEGALLISQPAGHLFSIGGMIANGVVGAKGNDGAPVGFVYDHVTALLVMLWDGSIREIKEESIKTPFDPLQQDLQMWRGSLGLLGIIIAAEFELKQDFGWRPLPFHFNYYNFKSRGDRARFQADQFAYNQNEFGQHFVGGTNPKNGETEIGTMTAIKTGIPFAPNTQLGQPLDAENAAKKAEYQALYASLLANPQNSDMAYNGAGELLSNPNLWCQVITAPNLITEDLCKESCSGTSMPCSAVDCASDFLEWPKAVGAFFENSPFTKLSAFGNGWNTQAVWGNDGFWATTPYPPIHEFATFVPMNATQDMLQALDAYFEVERQYKSDIDAHFNDPVNNAQVYARRGIFTWRYQTISDTSDFAPLTPGSYAHIDLVEPELSHLDRGHAQGDWGRLHGELETRLDALGSMNHLGKEHGWATTPKWQETNVRGSVLVEYQNETIIEKVWSDAVPLFLGNAPRHVLLKAVTEMVDQNATFLRGYQKQLLHYPPEEIDYFEPRNLVGFPCKNDWECLGAASCTDRVCT